MTSRGVFSCRSPLHPARESGPALSMSSSRCSGLLPNPAKIARAGGTSSAWSGSPLFVVLALALLANGVFGEDKPSPQSLLDAAHKAVDLSRIGPYVLTGTLVVNAGSGKEITGTVAFYRDHERARADLEIDGRNETRVSVGQKDYVDPERFLIAGMWLDELDRLWDPERPEKGISRSSDKWGGVSKHKVGSSAAWCMERKRGQDKDRLCIDAARHLVLTSSWEEFYDFAPLGDVMFPRRIRIIDPDLAPMEIRDIKIAPYPVENGLFEVPAKAIELESCEHGTEAKVVDWPVPVRSNLAQHPTNAKILLYTFIDKQGQVAGAKILNLVQPGFDERVLAAVKKWRFKPATCDTRPVSTAVLMEVDGHSF